MLSSVNKCGSNAAPVELAQNGRDLHEIGAGARDDEDVGRADAAHDCVKCDSSSLALTAPPPICESRPASIENALTSSNSTSGIGGPPPDRMESRNRFTRCNWP